MRRWPGTALERAFPSPGAPWRALGRALRSHQWVKNLLLFVPLIGAHRFADAGAWLAALEGFAAWCLLASAVYVLNDLLDLEADRAHPRKKARPFASGDASIFAGVALVVVLAAGALVPAARHPAFAAWLALYAAMSIVYSAWLKKLAVLDVLTLAFLYVLRIAAGGVLVDVPVSAWLVAFAAFFFLSLAMLKRFHGIGQLRAHAVAPASQRRGYRLDDQQPV